MYKTSTKKHNAFIKTLKQILQNNQYFPIISITEQQNGFVIQNLEYFKQEILGKHFNHNNFQSFRRQLNLYGFKLVITQNDSVMYVNENCNLQQDTFLKMPKQQFIYESFSQDLQNCCLALKEIQSRQQQMIQQITLLSKAQNNMINKIKFESIKYLQSRIRAQFHQNIIQRFVYDFYNSIKSKKYSNKLINIQEKFIKKQFVYATNMTTEAYEDDYFFKKCYHYVPAQKVNSILLINLHTLKLLRICLPPLPQITNEEDDNYQEQNSSSNLSYYFDL